ncbi:MAG: amino acid ABC transporter substrate-binding protein [Acetobacteraceae bacterium]|nr:amino acid ABC transporter substrate-binding protein [Acetobacteraceae bacterium]
MLARRFGAPLRVCLPLLALVLLAPAGWAQTDAPTDTGGGTAASASDRLTGTLGKIHDSGAVTIGYRTASFPFSYMLGGRPVGYSIDLCLGIVGAIEKAVDREVRVDYVPVTSDSRIPDVRAGKIDLECGSTTSNAERQKQVSFSPIMFIAGTKLMVKRASGIRSYRDLAGKTVVFTAGTTNEAVMRKLDERNHLGIKFVSAPDHDASFAMVADGKADAFATDDVLLSGLIATHHASDQLMVVGDFLSYEPYAIMFRRDDPAFAEVVEHAFESMAEDRDLLETYHRWFQRPTISGERLNLPMSAELSDIFRLLGVQD